MEWNLLLKSIVYNFSKNRIRKIYLIFSIINHGSLKQNKYLWEPILMVYKFNAMDFSLHSTWGLFMILHTNIWLTYIENEKLNTDRNGKNQNHDIMNYNTREIWITIYGNKHRNVVISICYNKVMKTLQKILCTVDELKQLFRHIHLIINCIHEITFIILWRLHTCNSCRFIYQHWH